MDTHIRGAGGAMRKVAPLTEAELDAKIAESRERYCDHFDAYERRLAQRERAARPSVIPLDGSLLARAARWLRGLSLKGPLT